MSSTTTEIWLPVVDWESYYSVSSLGRVRSEKRIVKRQLKDGEYGTLTIPEIIVSTPPNTGGYPTLQLCRDGHQHSVYVHDLVAGAFLGEKPPGQQVRHLDGDKKNCVPSNLAYGTPSENQLDAVRNGTHVQASKTECIHGHLFSEDNIYRRPNNPRVRYCIACIRDRRTRKTPAGAVA